ncbi:conserved hypothetical protein [Neospora caninum Liverpool]|uniref:RRP12 HEAT domain-containing protein n=1 Tax=Neospora caninum (strain Liverpool) TaxID=572307 RepID=F0VFB1_NEOCL|nr:conserved hypothetical protein [Neospora caninum Liverpool]CBZ52405.1 conserved hypothetical protein [Neospora caninum Liverpool]CEL66377.1 TPA: hypothetical protein BN1204_021940 [Neospora caninum Liverpool]|eukprot:XP_003882437.1 conserved hypothetical protein [Neospora caninum Liverpool]
MGTQKAPARLRGQKTASVSAWSLPSVSSSSDDAAVATLLRERQVFRRTEELLRKRAQEAETPQDEGDDMDNVSSQKRDEEDDFLLTTSEHAVGGSSLLLVRCSPFDAGAALDCLDLLRQGVDGQTAPTAHSKGVQTSLLSTSLHTLLVCVCKEAASGAEAPDNERTRRITTGLSLLFALLVDEGLPQSPSERHRMCHEDAALLDSLLKAIEAVSTFLRCASPRPLLLLLHALRRIYVPSQGSDEKDPATCGCLPTRAVWACLLRLLTEDPRASVRWLARQVALHLLRLATECASEASTAPLASNRKPTKALESLQTCMGVLDRWVRRLDFTVVPETLAARASTGLGTSGEAAHGASVPASTRLQRSLPFFHRCLPPLLCLENTQAESEKRRAGAAQSAASLPQPPHKAAEALCIRLAFLSRRAGRTPAAADALRCVASVIRDVRRFRGFREGANTSADASASGRSVETKGKAGDACSEARPATSGSAFSLTVQLLPALLQQQRAQGTQRGLWDELGERGKGSAPVSHGAVQYATAWLDAVTATTAALMHWAGEAREAWKAPEEGEAQGGSFRGGASETSGATTRDAETLDETLLLQQLEKLSLGGGDSDARIKSVVKESEALPRSSGSDASVSASSFRLSICMQAVERVFRSLRRVLETEADPSIVGAASVAGRRLIEASGVASVPAFPSSVSFCLSLLHFRHKRRLPEGLEASRALFAALEAVACKQFLDCTLHPELDRFRRPAGPGSETGNTSSVSHDFDGKCLPQFLHQFLEIYRPCFKPLLRQVVGMLAVVETGEEPERSEESHEKKRTERKKTVEEIFGLAKDNPARTDLQRHDLLPYRGRIRLAFSAALRAFKARTVLTDPQLLPIRSRIPISGDLSPQQLAFLLERCPVTNAWALPLLPRLLGRDELRFFSAHFLPLARLLQQQTAVKAKKNPLEARELCRVGQQLWSLLPGFSCDPIDLATGVAENDFSLMKNMIQFLHDPVLREEICATIRNLSNAALVESEKERITDDEDEDKNKNEQERDDAEKDVMSVLCRATKPGGRQSMQACGPQLMGFLVVRFLQVHKISLKKEEETAGERALAAMLLGEKEDLEQLTQSAKMKATQHLLGAIRAYAPLCPPDLLHANVRRFTSAFLRRANEAAGLSASTPPAPVTMGVAECSALVDITDALHPFLPSSVGLEVFDSLRTLVAACAQGLERAAATPAEQNANLAGTNAQWKTPTGAPRTDDRVVLRALLRRGYKALKHVLERSACSSSSSSLAGISASGPSCFLGQQELESLWEIVVKARTVSCGTAAEKPRLGCLRAFVGFLTLAAQTARDGQEPAGTKAFWESFLVDRVFPTVVPEIILSLKNLNRLVRETAFSSLSALCEACDGDSAKLSRLAVLIATGLGGNTGITARGGGAEPPILKTAAVLALSRIVFSYGDQMDDALVQQISEVVLLLLQDRDKQVFLAALRFARVIAHVLDGPALERFLPAMLSVLNSRHAIRAKMKIRRLIEKLLKKLGEGSVQEAFPSEHLPLLRHLQKSVRKQQLRELLVNKALHEGLSWDELDFKHGIDDENEHTNGRGKRGKKENDAFSEIMDEDDEEDEDDEDRPLSGKKAAARKRRANTQSLGEEDEEVEDTEKKDSATSFSPMKQLLDAFEEEDDSDTEGRRNRNRKRTRATSGDASTEGVMLLEDSAGELPLDFCSAAAAHRVILNQPLAKHRRRILPEAERNKVANLTWNEEGRLVIPENEDEEDDRDPGFTIGKVSSAAAGPNAGRGAEKKSSSPSALAKNRKVAQQGVQRKNLSCLAARREAMKSAREERRRGHFVQKSGDEFKAKKARGDVKQNNKVEPFAYIRLNRVMLREKHRPQALQSLATLVKKKKRVAGEKGKSKTGVRKPMSKTRKSRR